MRRYLAVVVTMLMVLSLFPVSAGAGAPVEFWVDGSFDDTTDGWGVTHFASIQDAITAAADNAVINVYPGIYEEGGNFPSVWNNQNFSLWINKPITIQGVDSDGTPITSVENIEATIHGTRQAGFGANVFIEADDVTIIGLGIRPRGADYGPYEAADNKKVNVVNKAIEVLGDNFTLMHSYVGTYWGDEVYAGYNAGAVYINESGAESALIQNNILYGSVSVNNGAGQGLVTIADNTIYNYYPGVSAIGIAGNIAATAWQNNSSGIPVVTGNTIYVSNETIWTGDCHTISAIDDDISELPNTAWLSEVLYSNTFSAAVVLIKDNEAKIVTSDEHGWNRLRVYGSVHAAMLDAEPGDTVVIFAGDYPGGINVDKEVTLIFDPNFTEVAFTIYPSDFTEEDVITIVYSGIQLNIPAALLPSEASEVQITITPLDADAPEGFTILGQAYRFVMMVSGEPLTEFSGNMIITFNFDPNEVDDPANLVIYWYNPTTETWEAQESVVDAVNNRVSLETDHWSDFALMDIIAEEEEEPTGPSLPDTGSNLMWLLPLGLLLMLAGAFWFRRRATA